MSNALKNEQAIEALADIFDQIVEILSDDAVASAARSNNNALTIKLILKNHSRSIFEIMATLENTPVEEYECDIFALPAKLLELFNRPEFTVLFQSQGQKEEKTSSGSAMENIEDPEN